MKSIYFLIFLSVCAVFNANAESKSDREISAVGQRVEQLRLALISADRASLIGLTSDQLSYGHSGGHIEEQAEFVEKIVSQKSKFITAEFQNQTIRLVGDTAIVRHILNAHTRDAEVEKNISIGIIMVWQKQKGVWKLIARQGYKLPTETH